MALIESGRSGLGQQGTADAPILRINDIFKSFDFSSRSNSSHNRGTANRNKAMLHSKHQVLAGLEMKISEGEFVTIVGSSGCGKSTLLGIIAGLDKPDSGIVLLKGSSNISSTKRIVIFQEGALFPWLSVQENVEFGLRIANVQLEKRRQITEKYIELVGLSKFSESFVYQLSGGMKQRVAIARALAMEPEILLMDEPFAALDVQTRDMLLEELVGIHKTTGKTILFVTHNISEAILLGDRVMVLSAALKNIRKEFLINPPRPRDLETPELYEIKRQILSELESDLQDVRGRG